MVSKGRAVLPHAEVMNGITSGAPQAQALLLGFAQTTPVQRQHLFGPLNRATAAPWRLLTFSRSQPGQPAAVPAQPPSMHTGAL